MSYITISFQEDLQDDDLLEQVKDAVQREYDNGGFDGMKPTIVVTYDSEE